jgi:hypothetical protein
MVLSSIAPTARTCSFDLVYRKFFAEMYAGIWNPGVAQAFDIFFRITISTYIVENNLNVPIIFVLSYEKIQTGT